MKTKKVCMYTTSYKTLYLHPLMYLDVSRMGGYIVCLSLQITCKLKFIIIILTQKEKQNIFHNMLRGLVNSRAGIFPWRSSWIFTSFLWRYSLCPSRNSQPTQDCWWDNTKIKIMGWIPQFLLEWPFSTHNI